MASVVAACGNANSWASVWLLGGGEEAELTKNVQYRFVVIVGSVLLFYIIFKVSTYCSVLYYIDFLET